LEGERVVSGLKGCTILVADDERYISTIISLKLRQVGAKVIHAIDGLEAFELACAHSPSLVIADSQMPEMDGLELAERMKTCQATAHIPVLMLTNRGPSVEPIRMAQTNIRALLAKPFSARELLAKLAEVVLEMGIAA
jgi:DNA-binding response OmpR family regulator